MYLFKLRKNLTAEIDISIFYISLAVVTNVEIIGLQPEDLQRFIPAAPKLAEEKL